MKFKHILLTLLFLSINAYAIVGATKGSADVAQGSFTYDVEVITPKGVSGLQPSLRLNYNSSNSGNSIFGVGFSISGLSSITKCNESLFDEKADSSRNYNYCLDGQKLLLVDTAQEYGSENSEYKTEINNHSKIVKTKTSWKVWSKDGLIHEYGNTADSNDGEVFYKISKISDRYDNDIDFIYASGNNHRYIKQIKYSNNTIDFIYEDRDDKKKLSTRGVTTNIDKRVKKISINTANKEVSSYELNYEYSNNFSRITNITECANGECLEPVVFGWEETLSKFGEMENWGQNSTDNLFYRTTYSLSDGSAMSSFIDLNGDGLPDKVHYYNTATSQYGYWVQINTGHSFGEMENWGQNATDNAQYRPTWTGTNGSHSSFLDVNGDGLPDRVHHYNYFTGKYAYWVQLNTGHSFGPMEDWGGSTHTSQYNQTWSDASGTLSSFLDVNGDGLPDRVHHHNYFTGKYAYWVQLNTGHSFGPMEDWGGSTHTSQYNQTWSDASGTLSSFLDVNGDGLPDRVHHHNYFTGKYAYWVQLNTGHSFGPMEDWGGSTHTSQYNQTWSDASGTLSSFLDVNGDGLPDRVHHNNYTIGQRGYWVQINSGSSFGEMQNWGQNATYNEQYRLTYSDASGTLSSFLDVNGDGLPDRVHHYNYTTSQYGYWVQINTGSSFGEMENWGQNASNPLEYRQNWIGGLITYSTFLDVNGDGLPDRVHHYNYTTSQYGYWVQINQTKKAKIISVNNSKDQDLQIEYSTLRDAEIYTALEDAELPELDIKASPMSIVKSFKVADAVGGFNTTTFKYEGFKVHRERGSLGFSKIETFNDISNTKTITEYHQTFPFVGISKNSESYLGESTKLSSESSSIQQQSYFSNPAILNLEITGNTQIKNDINGAYLLTHETINSNFDKYGNILNIKTTTKNDAENYSIITQNVYTNDESKWILSRLTSAKVTHVHADGSTVEKTSAFIYDVEKGTLSSEVIEPASAKQLVKSYQYDTSGNKILETVSGTDIEARSTKYLYDAQGKNIIKIINSLGHSENREYDINNQLIKITGPNSLSTSFSYDAMGKKVQELRADGSSTIWSNAWDNSIANSMFRVTKKSTGSPESIAYFNKAGKKIRTIKVGFDGSKIYEDTFYDALGRVVKYTTPHYEIDASVYIYNTYDALGRVTSTDRPGATGNRIQNTVVYSGLDVTTTKANTQAKTTKNNIIGKKLKVIEGNSFIDYKYDAFGKLVQTTDSKGNVITLTYDLFGNKIGMNDPDMGIWSYEYNALGKLIKQTDAKGQFSTMTYDLLGRMVKRVEAEGETTWTYDRSVKGIGKLSYVQNADYRKEFYYDNFGRLQNIKEFIDANVFNTSYVYNSEGKLEKTISPDGFTSINEYNKQGYLQAVKSPKVTSNLYSYDEIKNAIEDSLNVSMQFASEAVNYSNQAEKQSAKGNLFLALANDITDESLKTQLKETAALSIQTALLLKTSSNDAQDESIKALNRVNYFLKMASKFKDANFYEFVASKFRAQTRFYIDMALVNLNNAITSVDGILVNGSLEAAYLQQEKDMINSHIAQTRSLLVAAQGLSQKVVNYKTKHIDAVNKIETLSSTTYFDMLDDKNYNYFYKVLKADEFGRVISDIIGNGLITKKEYNKANGHLNYITTGYNGDNDIRDISYTFDDMNNVLSRVDAKQNITSSFTYDALNRVSSANITGDSFSTEILYAYDSIGNMLSKSDLGSYAYQKAHQVVAAGSNTYEYDANGNAVRKNDTTITYSSYNKPTQIEDSNHKTNFFYAPNRARYKKTLDGDTTYYAGKLFEKEIINAKVRYKNFIYAGGNLVAINVEEDDGELLVPSVRYLHKGALNSTDTVTNESGEVIQRLAYKPFGERIVGDWINQVDDANAITKRGFTGHEHISEFNLIHMNGRVYDPVIGKFLSADPYIQAPYDTQSYNRYSYVKNNPLKYVDPSGFFFGSIAKFFKKVVNFVKKNWRVIVAVIVAIVITVVTLGTAAPAVAALWAGWFGTGIGASMAAGAVAGFASGAIITGTWKGALTGALTGAIGGAVGGYYAGLSKAGEMSNMAQLGRVVAKGAVGGINSKINGGKFADGFKMGIATASARYLYNSSVGKDTTFRKDGPNQMGLSGDTKSEYKLVEFANEHIASDKSEFMKMLSWLPGVNSFAKLHDSFFITNGGSMPFNMLTNIPSMVPALAINYAALYDKHSVVLEMDRHKNERNIYRRLF
ncbi:RHS repeat-associated core domain-containing protein [Sulfurimonas sp.]|uniref:RHS repeat-associated core domain-containing protein n=1 Tax=Sulfurimonas sp. TaxID=2022749 RepID=UPI002AAFB523|nr:RHS repeat-associated core domain-containing protein [Sulfurimonas sp.]